MANRVIIGLDSNGDLSPELCERYGIKMLAGYVVLGTKYLKDGIEIQADDVFDYVKRTGQLPKTSAVMVEDYKEMWKPYLDEGYDIVHFTIASGMSSGYQNAVMAADEIGEGRVFPVDTMNLSTGMAQLAIEAAIQADKGKSAREVFDYVEEKKHRLNVSFVIDTMEYLAKGGRCSSVVALAAGMLKLKPCIEVVDGKMTVGRKYRGKINQVLRQYVHDRLSAVDIVDPCRIFVTHSGVAPEIVEEIKQQILTEKKFDEILETRAGCSVSSHCGPGTLGILFFEA